MTALTWLPPDDPIPWVTDGMHRAGAFDDDDLGRVVRSLLGELTQGVSALHDDAKAYTVVLSSNNASAATSIESKVVEIGSKPWRDDTLTDGQRAACMMGLVLHEVGHIRYSRLYTGALNRLFGKGNITGAIKVLSNLAADHHDENAARKAFPGLSRAIPIMLWWVGDKGMQQLDANEVDDMVRKSAATRVNLAIAATRYPWQADWSSPAGITWMKWWKDWAVRARNAERPKDHALIVQEAIEYVRAFQPATIPPTPTPPPPLIDDDSSRPDGPGPMSDPGPDMSDEPPEPKDDPNGEDDEGDDDDESEGNGSDGESNDSPDEGDDEPDAGRESGTDDHDDAGQNEQDDSPGGEPTTTEQGGLGDDGDPDYDPNEDDTMGMDDTCAVEKSKDPVIDGQMQQAYEKAQRGQRDGLRRRRYVHQTSYHGQPDHNGRVRGRVVIAIPRKGSKWVYDG